jgi:hypothetical protein
VIILDITDKRNPKFISQLDYHVPRYQRPEDPSPDDAMCAAQSPAKAPYISCGNTHAAKIVPGRNLLLVSDEYFNCPYGHVRLVDIKNEKDPKVISHFWYDANLDCERDWGPSTTPSAHLGTAKNSNLYFMAWYAFGLRAIDISNPYYPVEAGHFFYRNFDGAETSVTYDANFGPGGLLYVTDNVDGIRVLKYTGQGMSGKK